MKFRIIFVMDLKDGVVVHARKGEREKYEPVHRFSSVVDASEPAYVVKKVNPTEVYIADLDKIMGKGDNKVKIREIRAFVRDIMLDFGVRSVKDAFEAVEFADNIVLGTETASLELIDAVVGSVPSGVHVSVSIDILRGQVLARDRKLREFEPLQLVKMLNEYALKDVILLNLDKVGTKWGVDADFYGSAVAKSSHNILCGGGVRGCEDLIKLKDVGVSGALVATAIHDGSIPLKYLRF